MKILSTIWVVTLVGLNLMGRSTPSYAIDRQAQIELGALLFHDSRLSGNNKVSCATCHNPEYGYTDGLPLARGSDGSELRRNTMTLLHSADQPSYYWDGRGTSLVREILARIKDPDIMDQDPKLLVQELSSVPNYVLLFSELYGTKINMEGIARALSAYLKTIVTNRAPFDRYLAGQKRAISFQARRGMELFQGKARCAFCHKGFNFTDSDFHNIGVPELPGQQEDLGRYEVTGRKDDRGAFKTPTLRNIEQTGPYMHNGIFETLEEVVEFYDQGGTRNRNLDSEMKPLGLTQLEKEELVLFMKTLTGDITAIEKPNLPE